jgi:pimeloyl-ACP methyl ester carboxylesterase
MTTRLTKRLDQDNQVDYCLKRQHGCLTTEKTAIVWLKERKKMTVTPSGSTLPGITHHRAEVNGTGLHYIEAGSAGSPILLVHGFPESWWAFRRLIPMLAKKHRVFAVDLRGFGDSDNSSDVYDSKTSAEDLHALIGLLDVGPVHLTGQDISGATVFRLASTHPEDVLSLTAIEMGLAGFGLEALGDVTRGGSWPRQASPKCFLPAGNMSSWPDGLFRP